MRSRQQEHFKRMSEISKAIKVESALNQYNQSVTNAIDTLKVQEQRCRECDELYCLHCYDKNIH